MVVGEPAGAAAPGEPPAGGAPADPPLAAVVARWVGHEKDVIAIGPDIGAVRDRLVGHGCRVTGVELGDGANGGTHRSGVDAVVIDGSLGALDDPAAVLRDLSEMLRPGGAVIASLPLSDPDPRGEMSRAGLTLVEAEAMQDRLVVRAVPSRPGTAAVDRSGAALARARGDLISLFAELDEMRDLVAPELQPAAPRVGLTPRGSPGSLEDAVLSAVVRHEVRRRLPAARVVEVASGGEPVDGARLDGLVVGGGGEPPVRMPPSAPVLRLDARGMPHPLLAAARAFPREGLRPALLRMRAERRAPAAGRPLVAVVADASLAERAGDVVAALAVAEERAGEFGVVAVAAGPGSDAAAKALADAVPEGLHRLSASAESAEETLALIAGAGAVVSPPGPMVPLAVAYGAPCVVLAWSGAADARALADRCGEGGLVVVERADALAGAIADALEGSAPAADPGSALDPALDEHVAEAARHAYAALDSGFRARLRGTARELGEHVVLLRSANAELRRRIENERVESTRLVECLRAAVDEGEAALGRLEQRARGAEERRRSAEAVARASNRAVIALQLELAARSQTPPSRLPSARTVVALVAKALLRRRPGRGRG